MLGLSLAFEIVADYYFKIWSIHTEKVSHLVAGLVCYSVATLFFAFCLRHESMTKIVCLFTITNCVAATLIGLWFGDPFPLRVQAGLVLALASIWMLR